jgi:molybdopterin-guanine dinucleotide biosynthesis protein B
MILGIYGRSNSGKTTLIVKLIKELKKKGYRVASAKNIHSPNFTIDTEGKDTWKHTQAGSEIVVAHSEDETAFLVHTDMNPQKTLNIIDSIMDLDIVIVEGHWDDDSPKVALGDIDNKPNTVLRYKDNYDEILKYAIHGIEVDGVEKKLPGLDCGKCGMQLCRELADSIHLGKNSFDDCYYFSEMKVSLKVDDKQIPLGKFAKEVISGTLEGMVSSLKGVEKGKKIVITVDR